MGEREGRKSLSAMRGQRAKEIAALVGGIGLLGIITELTFQLEPAEGLTMVETRNGLDDAHIAFDVKKMLHDETPFVIVHWRADFGKYRTVLLTPLKAGEKLPASAPRLHPKARSAYMNAVADDFAGYVKETLSVWEGDPLESSPTADVTNAGICGLSNELFGVFFFVDEDGTLLDVTLPTNRAMLAAEFGGKSNSLLSTSAGDEDVVYIQWTSLEAVTLSPEKHQKIEAMLQTYEQLMLCKYKARPHWGKNYERVFRHPMCHVRENYPESNFAQMLQMQQQHDPKKMFEPQLYKQVLERSRPSYYARCASALWCYCEEDVHCPTGNVCRPSPIFPEYKICILDTHRHLHDEL